jgi:hypothetical protein
VKNSSAFGLAGENDPSFFCLIELDPGSDANAQGTRVPFIAMSKGEVLTQWFAEHLSSEMENASK